jgi:hypothetical protein
MEVAHMVLVGWIKAHIAALLPTAIVLVAVAAFAVLQSRDAGAQTPGNGTGIGHAEVNQAFTCGREQASVVRTWENAFFTNAGTFVQIPAAALNVTIPAGTDCILVTFSAKMWTSGTGDLCYLRAFLGANEMSPTGGGLRSVISFDASFDGRTYVWADKITVATQTTTQVRIEMSSNSNQGCNVDDWLLNIERKD